MRLDDSHETALALDPSPSGEGESASADRGAVLRGQVLPTPARSFASTRPPLRGGIDPGEGLPPIQYRFERRDLWRLSRILYRPGWAKRLVPPLIALVFLFGMVIYGVGGWPNARQWASLLRRPDIVAMTIALLVFWANMHLISMAILTARFRSLAIADKTIRLGFSQSGLDADVEGVASHIPWPKFTARIEEEDRVVLKIARWEAMTVPRRAFPNEASWQAALAFLRQKVPHAG